MAIQQEVEQLKIFLPPPFCQYAAGPCDQNFDRVIRSDAFFLYPSTPPVIANTIEEAIQHLGRAAPGSKWLSWKDLGISGQIIFCQICKALRFTKVVIADVTTLNFNLLFEIGYAIGLGLPVLPIRDTTYIKDQKVFDELGLLDTLGYLDFQNSDALMEKILLRVGSAAPVTGQAPPINREQPLYLIKSHVYNQGMVKLMSAIKKSGLWFRTFDPRETSRLSLHEAFKQIFSSLGVVVHLVDPARSGSIAHNSRCAFVAGMGMAAEKHVLMLQETDFPQPIDYRDVVRSYSNPANVPELLIPVISEVVGQLQESRFVPVTLPLRPLEKIDLGDLAAENEIKALRSYFSSHRSVQRSEARACPTSCRAKRSGQDCGFLRHSERLQAKQITSSSRPEARGTPVHEAPGSSSQGIDSRLTGARADSFLELSIAHGNCP